MRAGDGEVGGDEAADGVDRQGDALAQRFERGTADAGGARVTDMPFIAVRQGGDQRSIAVNWSRPAKGSVMLKARMDQPG